MQTFRNANVGLDLSQNQYTKIRKKDINVSIYRNAKKR